MLGRSRLELKTADQLRQMRVAGLIVARALEAVAAAIRPGVTTLELDAVAEDFIRASGGKPNFSEVPGYRHTLCVSVNDEIVHGIPGERVLVEGDLVSVDCGCYVGAWHGDAARTFAVGGWEAVSAADKLLSEVTERSMWAGMAALRVGGRVSDVGEAVEASILADGAAAGTTFGIVQEYVGHGIGRAMHMYPNVPNYRTRDRGPKIGNGTTLAIEPMVTAGSADNHVRSDDWTVATDDGSRASHWENTVAVTEAGLCVLTEVDGGQQRLSELGASYVSLD